MNPGDKITVRMVRPWEATALVAFYMWYENVPNAMSQSHGKAARREFFIVDEHSLTDLSQLSVKKIAEFREADLYVSDSGLGQK